MKHVAKALQPGGWFRIGDVSFLHAVVEVLEHRRLENNDADRLQGRGAVLVHHFNHSIQHCISHLLHLYFSLA